MAARRKKEPQINLLPQEEFAASTIGRVLAWLLTSFRIIVIVTEMVVMGAFLSRFWLDAQNSDLADEIRQQQAIINSTASFERDFKTTQQKLNIFAALAQESDTKSPLFTRISTALPPDVRLSSFAVTGTEIQIKASSLSERSVEVFLANLRSITSLKDVSLSQASIETGSQSINFTVKAGVVSAPVAAGGGI
jgi:Tfp pilus assembly protein PilN